MERLLTTYEEATKAFRCRDLRQALYDEGEHLMGGVIVNLHGEAHVARRRLENRLFRRDTFAWYEQDRIPAIVADVLAPALAAGRGELIDLARRTMLTLSIEVAGVDVVPPDFDRFDGLMRRMARAATVAHATGDKAAIIADGDDALAAFDREFYRPSLARRAALVEHVASGGADAAVLPRDVLTTLLHNQDRLDLLPDVVLREVAYYPWVGSHSTSTQLVHAMHHLFEWIAGHPADAEAIALDDALRQRFVHESMRLHPASPVALRIATLDVTLGPGAGLSIGRDERVTISVEQANRDRSVFGEDADAFDPHRRLPEGVPPWGLSFGHGMHSCLGQELAGGLEPGDGNEHHLVGSVVVMTGAMLRAGARPDPADPPSLDANTTRVMWGRYPVTFDLR